MSAIFGDFKLGTGENGIAGYNISLYYQDTAGINLHVSGRKDANSNIEEIEKGNPVRINAKQGFSIVYDHASGKFTLASVKGDGENFDNDGFRKNYIVNSLKVGTGDAFDTKISMNSLLADIGAQDEVAIIGANDGRDYTDKKASMLYASLDSTPIYVFYAGKRLFVHVHRARASYLGSGSFIRTGVPLWGKDFSVKHG